RIPALDGFSLGASIYRPRRPAASGGVVLISGATGVSRAFYRGYARYLAEREFVVVTYDYRGVGGSRPQRLRDFEATLQEWGTLDLAGAISWCGRFASGRLFLLAHSVGGQIFGLAPNMAEVHAVLGIGAQEGFWANWPFPRNLFIWMLSQVVMPLSLRTCGY